MGPLEPAPEPAVGPPEARQGTCPEPTALRRWLQAPDDAACDPALDAHIDVCPRCQGQLERWCDLNLPDQGVVRLFEPTLLAEAESSVMARIRDRIVAASRSTVFDRLPAPGRAREPRTEEAPTVIGPYRILRHVGAGGMGCVYEAIDPRLGRRVAVKRFWTELTGADQARGRLDREATVQAALNHPRIVPVYEVGVHQGQPYLVLEYIRGGPLSRWLSGGPATPTEAAQAVLSLAQTVQYAHDQGVIHRDLKPSNVLLKPLDPAPTAPEGPRLPLDRFQLMVADFSLARWQQDPQRLTRSGQLLGTPTYMAPEQVDGREPGGPAVDVHALGVLLYELLTGRPPYQAATLAGTLQMVLETEPIAPRRLQPTLPRDLDTIVLRCLEKTPGRRYPSAGALADDLQRFLEHRPLVARPVGPSGRLVRWVRRKPGVAALSGLAAALVLALAVGSVLFAVRQTQLRNQSRELLGQLAGQLFQTLGTHYEIVERQRDGQPVEVSWILEQQRQQFQTLASWCDTYLAGLDPTAVRSRDDVRITEFLIRLNRALERFDLARQQAEQFVAMTRRWVRQQPDDPERVDCALIAAMNLAMIQSDRGDIPGVIACYEQAHQLFTAFDQRQPSPARLLQRDYALLGNLAMHHDELRQYAASIQTLRLSLPIGERLAALEPANVAQTLDLLDRGQRIGDLLRALGQPDAALAQLDQTLAELDQRAGRSPDPAAFDDLRQQCQRLRNSIQTRQATATASGSRP